MLSASVSIDFSAPAAGPLLVPSNCLRYSRPQHLHSFHWMLGLDGQQQRTHLLHDCQWHLLQAWRKLLAGCGPPLVLGVWFHILLGMCLCTDLLQAMRFIMLSPAPAAGCVRPLFIWGSHPEHDHRRRLHPIFRIAPCMAVPRDIHQGLEMDPTRSPHLGYVSPALPPAKVVPPIRALGTGHWA